MAIKREDLIPSILNKVRQTFNDDKGFFRQGKFTPVQQVQNISQQVGQTKLPSGITLKQLPSAYMQSFSQSRTLPEKLMNIGTSSFLKTSTFGLLQPQAPKAETLPEKFMSGLGGLTGFVGPGSLGGKAMTGLDKLGQAGITKFAPKLQTTLIGKVTGGLGKEALQTAGYVGGKYLSGKSGLRPDEKITGKSILQDLAIGAAMRGITTPGNLSAVKGMTGKNKMTFKPKSVLKGEEIDIIDQINERLGKTKDISWEDNNFLDNVLRQRTNATQGQLDNLTAKQKLNELLTFANRSEGFKGVTMGISDQPIKTGTLTKEIVDENYRTATRQLQDAEDLFERVANPNSPEYDPKAIKKASEIVNTFEDGLKKSKTELEKFYTSPPIKTGGVSPISPESKGIIPTIKPLSEVPQGKIAIKGKILPFEKTPEIVQPAKINTQTQQVVKPNKLDSSSESIIQQARQQIGKPIEPKKSFSQKYDEFYTNWVDRYNPIVKLTEGVKNIDPSKDPKYIIRRFLGAGGIAEQRFNTEMKPILKQIDDLGIDKTDLDTYLINKRNVGFGEIGRQVKGSDPIQSQKVVSALEAKYGDSIKGITDSIYEFQNKGLDEMVNAGFISPESAKSMRGQNPNYAPFQRVMDEMNDYLGLPTKKAMVGTQPIQKLKGSEKQILSPVESIISNIFSQRAAIEKNNVAKSVAGLQDVIPDLGFKKVSKGGDSTITVWNNGKKEFIEVGSDIARSMKGMNEESANSFMKILTAPASLLRQGATGRNPEFMLPNIIRDQLDAATNSKYGYVPFVDYIRGLYHVARKDITGADEVFDSWMKSGGSQSFGSITGRKSISEMFDKTKAKKGLFSWLGSGLDVAGKYSEVPTRLGLYGKALKKGATPLEAAYESREGTMDFARMGAKMKVANSIIPFLNVQLQGFDKMIRNFKNAPAKTIVKMGLYGVAPAVMTTLYNEMYHPSEYAEIPQYVKDDNFVFVKGRNEKGTVDYVTIPKGNLIRLATNPTESFISYLAGNDKTTFGEMATQFLSSNLPLLGEGQNIKEVAIKTIGQNIPQAIKPITENLMNKSFYKYDTKKEQSKEIVPYYLQNKPPAEQTYKFTPAMYQTIGKIVNVSPLKVQNLMEGYLAGYTKIPANIIDSLKNISEGKDVEQNKVPILRRFIQETYPTSTTVAKPTTERTSLIPQVQASEGGFLDKIFPSRLKTQETTTDIKYTNKNGNEATIKLSKVTSMPEQTAYQRALKEKQKYTLVDDILDNLDGDQQIEALQTLGISSEDATYYNTAKQENYLKSIYVEEEIMDMIKQGQNKDQILNNLVSMRKAVNEKILLSDGVINDLVDKNIISYTDGKALKNIDKDLTTKKTGTKAKKPKKISLSSKKFTASKKKYNPLKVKSTTTKSRFTPPKYVKADLRTPTKLL